MTEREWQPPFELVKTDHGVDGWDARTWVVARFTSRAKAVTYLAARGFTYVQHGAYYHEEEARRHTMGAISYEIRAVPVEVPVDPV